MCPGGDGGFPNGQWEFDMFKKWLQIIFDHKISLRERMFRLVTGISMIALIFILVLGRFTANLFILARQKIFQTTRSCLHT